MRFGVGIDISDDVLQIARQIGLLVLFAETSGIFLFGRALSRQPSAYGAPTTISLKSRTESSSSEDVVRGSSPPSDSFLLIRYGGQMAMSRRTGGESIRRRFHAI